MDRHGRAVGVLKAKIDTKEALRRTGRVFTDLGVFVDARRVVRFLERSEIQYWLDGKTPIERSVDELEALGLALAPFTPAQAELAGALWKHTRSLGLALGDRACLALGLEQGAAVYTADRVWTRLDLGVAVRSIR